MDLLFISDSKTLNHELETALREVGGDLRVVSGQAMLEGSVSTSADVVLVEKRTWQNNYSMFRYFGRLGDLDRAALVCVSRSRRAGTLKGRAGRKDLALALPSSADVIRRTLEDARELTGQMRGA